MPAAFYFIFAFCLGAIPSAYWAGKALMNVDIRQHGSGNVGATNAFRVLGKGTGCAVLIFDLLKGALPVFLFVISGYVDEEPILSLLVGFTAVLGHVFTPFLGFKGGKGVATGGGVLLATYPVLFAFSMGAWCVCFLFTKIVSLSSLAAVSALCLLALFWVADLKVRLFFLAMAGFVYWTHRSNIGRLLRGEEKKVVSNHKI